MDIEPETDAGPQSIFDAVDLARAQLEQCCTCPALVAEHWAQNRLADFDLWSAGVGATADKRMSLDVRLQGDDAARGVLIGALSSIHAWAKKCAELADHDHHFQLSPSVKSLHGVSEGDALPILSDVEADDGEITLTEARNSVEELLHTLVAMGILMRHAEKVSGYRQSDRSYELDSTLQEYQDLKEHLEFLLRLPLELQSWNPGKAHNQSGVPSSNKSHDVTGMHGMESVSLSEEQRLLVEATLKRRHRIRFAQSQGWKLRNLPIVAPGKPLPTANMTQILGDSISQDDSLETKPADDIPGPPMTHQISFQPYTCFIPECSLENTNFDTIETWKSHIQNFHASAKHWTCFACDQPFQNETDLITHMQTLHSNIVYEHDLPTVAQMCMGAEQQSINNCPVCSVNKVDWEQEEKNSRHVQSLITKSFLDHVGACIYGFSLHSLPWKSSDDDHEVDETKARDHKRRRLAKEGNNSRSLETPAEMQTVQSGNDASWSSKQQLLNVEDLDTSSMDDELQETIHECPYCNQRWTDYRLLRRHLRSHRRRAGFECTVCSKEFHRKLDLKWHEAIHAVEKKFVCRGLSKNRDWWGCARRFAKPSGLAQHLRSEAGRECIKPLVDEEAEEQRQLQMQTRQSSAAPGSTADMLQPELPLPAALLQMYPDLARFNISLAPGIISAEGEDDFGDRSGTGCRPDDEVDMTG